MTLLIEDANRVRTLTLNRPEALNAFNEALYDATTQALLDAAEDPEVAVVLLTGAGRAFSAGTDLADMRAMITDPNFAHGKYGFRGLVEALSAFPKPLICAVNGAGLGIGTTILGYADLAFMSTTARRSRRQRRGRTRTSPNSWVHRPTRRRWRISGTGGATRTTQAEVRPDPRGQRK